MSYLGALNYVLSMSGELEELGMAKECHTQLCLLRDKIYKEMQQEKKEEKKKKKGV